MVARRWPLHVSRADREVRDATIDLMAEISASEAMTTVLVTHNLLASARCAERVVHLERTVRAWGLWSELSANPDLSAIQITVDHRAADLDGDREVRFRRQDRVIRFRGAVPQVLCALTRAQRLSGPNLACAVGRADEFRRKRNVCPLRGTRGDPTVEMNGRARYH